MEVWNSIGVVKEFFDFLILGFGIIIIDKIFLKLIMLKKVFIYIVIILNVNINVYGKFKRVVKVLFILYMYE